MSLSLITTKRRIKSVGSTKKITKAMELVSTSKQKKAKDIYASIAPFSSGLSEIMSYLSVNPLELKDHKYFKKKSGKQLLIYVGSSLGLCGGYNLNSFKFLISLNLKDVDFITIGQKGYSILKNAGFNIIKSYELPPLDVKEELSKYLINDILRLYDNYAKVSIIYTKFINNITMQPDIVDILPISNIKTSKKSNKELLIEPSQEEILNNVIPFYLRTLIKSSLLESMLCEHASRRMAMENASDNADELLDKLMIEYNKSRQGAITNEISEISGAANAQGR